MQTININLDIKEIVYDIQNKQYFGYFLRVC